MLDGKEINETSRQFLINWQASKEARHQQRERRRRHVESLTMQTIDSQDTIEGLQLPPTAFSGKVLMASSNPSQFRAMISTSGDGDGPVDRKGVRYVYKYVMCVYVCVLLNIMQTANVFMNFCRLPNIFAPPRYLHSIGDRSVWVPGTQPLSSQVQPSTSLSEQTKGTSSLTKPVDI